MDDWKMARRAHRIMAVVSNISGDGVKRFRDDRRASTVGGGHHQAKWYVNGDENGGEIMGGGV